MPGLYLLSAELEMRTIERKEQLWQSAVFVHRRRSHTHAEMSKHHEDDEEDYEVAAEAAEAEVELDYIDQLSLVHPNQAIQHLTQLGA